MPRTLLPTNMAESRFIEEDELLNNPVHTWEYADAASRGAASGFTIVDQGKLSLQKDENSYWVLVNHSPPTWVDFSHRRLHSIHGTSDHSDAPVDPPADGQILRYNASLGRYDPVLDTAGSAAYERPGIFFLGNLLDYNLSAQPDSAGEVQYTRVWLYESTEISSMEVFLTSVTGTEQIRMGIYDQTDPHLELGAPEDRVAQTDAYTLLVSDEGSFVSRPLQSSYVVPVTGYYWLAMVCTSKSVQFAGTPTFRAGYLPRRQESGTGSTLPLTAGSLTNPQSAVIFVAVEVG